MSEGIVTEAVNPDLPSSITQEYYPTIPEKFPSSRIPKNLCELELLKLYRCVVSRGDTEGCGKEYTGYTRCRRERDVKLFAEIKDWEIGHVRGLTMDERKDYVGELEKKRAACESELERIPYSSGFTNKMWRFQSELEQLKWRTDYINKTFKKPEPK